MNREYYEALGLKEDADQNDIKRAYFKLVRKYSPEKEPEKFREIREAYEYLSRAGQDQEGPDFGEFENVFEARMADQIKRADRDNDTGLALKTCEEAIRYYPEALYFQYERIRLERRMGHTGRAVKHAEALVEKNRENKFLLLRFIVLMSFSMIPYIGHVFNGFGYVTNRWIWALAMLVASIVVWFLPQIKELSKSDWKICNCCIC